MVTILEPRLDPQVELDLEAEPVALPEDPQPRAGYLEMRYAMPFAGVRYYSFKALPAAARESVKPAEPVVAQLKAELIDERVILL